MTGVTIYFRWCSEIFLARSHYWTIPNLSATQTSPMPAIPLQGSASLQVVLRFFPLSATKVIVDFDRILARTPFLKCLDNVFNNKWKRERCEIIWSESFNAIITNASSSSDEHIRGVRETVFRSRCFHRARDRYPAMRYRASRVYLASSKAILAVVCMQPTCSVMTLINVNAKGATRVFAKMRDPLALIIPRWDGWS